MLDPHANAHERFLALASRIEFPGLLIEVVHETATTAPHDVAYGQEVHSGHYLRVSAPEGTCNVTGQALPWKGRKWRLSRHMTDMEFMLTALKAILTAQEHEARECFRVDGVALFDSHLDLDRHLAYIKSGGGGNGRS